MSTKRALSQANTADAARLQQLLNELGKIIAESVPTNLGVVRLGDVYIQRATAPTQPQATIYTPVLCVVAQGCKEVRMGEERYTYDSSCFLVNSTPVPASGWVTAGNVDKPCLWISIGLTPALVREVVSAVNASSPSPPLRSMEASPIDVPLLEAVVRMARLFKAPEDFDFLSPLLLREIVYRLLAGRQANRVRQIVGTGEASASVMKAVERLRRDFTQSISIPQLAHDAGLSPSALHRHFKAVTSMTPVQYQRHLRLQEANRLMLDQNLDARQAGQIVGYDDPSYFSREYRRFFGVPPAQHAARQRVETPRGSEVTASR